MYVFVTAALEYSVDKIDGVEFLKQTIGSLCGNLPILEKIRMFIMSIHYLIKVGNTTPIEEMLKANTDLKPVFL